MNAKIDEIRLMIEALEGISPSDLVRKLFDDDDILESFSDDDISDEANIRSLFTSGEVDLSNEETVDLVEELIDRGFNVTPDDVASEESLMRYAVIDIIDGKLVDGIEQIAKISGLQVNPHTVASMVSLSRIRSSN